MNKSGDATSELLTTSFVIMTMKRNDRHYDTIYGSEESRRFLHGLYAACFSVAAGWGLLVANATKAPIYGQLRPSLSVRFPAMTRPTKAIEKALPTTRPPEPSVSTNKPKATDTAVALRQIDHVTSPPSFSGQQVIEAHVKDLVNNTEFAREFDRTSARTDDIIFDPRLHKKMNQASMRTTRVQTHRPRFQEYTDVSGNMVRRSGNTCAKNNQALADQMGIDTLFFAGSCSTKHYEIELNINLNTELHP